MNEAQLWELLDKLTKTVVEEENCVLNILIGNGMLEIQLIPEDLWYDGVM